MDYKPSENVLKLFLEELQNLSLLMEDFVNHHSDQDQFNGVNDLVRRFHSLKGGAGFLGYKEMSSFAAEVEEGLKSGKIELKDIKNIQNRLDVLRSSVNS
jgi:chemotaxis protein histidine kinase CheA